MHDTVLKILIVIESTEYLKKITDNIACLTNFFIIASLRCTTETAAFCQKLSPDILIYDLANTGCPTSDIIHDIKQSQTTHSVNIITTSSSKKNESQISASIKNGADLYMENLDDPEILKNTLNIIAKKRQFFLSQNSNNLLLAKADEILHKLKLPVHFTGYHYLRTILYNIATRSTKLPEFSCKMYETVAKEYNINPRQVERAINKSIKHITAISSNEYILDVILGYKINSSNYTLNTKELIALIADQLRLNYYLS